MCILISTTSHPDYPLIILSNRDEYLVRPTKLAHYRDLPNGYKILSPLDMARPEHGTWIGVTTEGKIAILVNYRETDLTNQTSTISRGILPIDYLSTSKLDEEWYQSLDKNQVEKIGGFSLLYGKLSINSTSKKINHLNILSNRGDRGKVFLNHINVDDLHDEISKKTTFGLSNSLYYQPWHKVKIGEILLHGVVEESIKLNWSQSKLIEKCFSVLSYNTFDEKVQNSNLWHEKLIELQNSIFIPPLNTKMAQDTTNHVMGNYYGTRTQTIILLDKAGNLSYYERDLHPNDSPTQTIRSNLFQFKIDLHEHDGTKLDTPFFQQQQQQQESKL